jgi:hypothetical protein
MSVRVSRRGFLHLAGFSAGMLALSRLRPLSAAFAAEMAGEATALRVLTPTDARILAAVAERMTFTGDAAMPRFSATDGLRTIDVALRQLPADLLQQLSWGLWIFEYAPPLFIGKPARFTGMNENWQDVYLADWAESTLQTRRMVFQALKNLSMLGYYAQDATWSGIHYTGPWVVRPRQVLSE